MEDYISAYEYEKNVNPQLNAIPIKTKNINQCNYGITFIDFSDLYNVSHKATSPNLLASFIKLKLYEGINLDNEVLCKLQTPPEIMRKLPISGEKYILLVFV